MGRVDNRSASRVSVPEPANHPALKKPPVNNSGGATSTSHPRPGGAVVF